MIRRSILLAAVVCATALLPAAASAATGSIEGTVTGSDTHAGIEGVEVCAFGFEAGGEEKFFYGCEYTAADGTYAIEEVPAGEYEVEFWAAGTGYLSRYYPGLVAVGSGATTGIDVELDPAAAIEGTVTRSIDGEPVEEVEVCAWDINTEEFGGCTESGSGGTYALEVPAGEWGVEFWTGFSGQNLAYQYFDHRDRWSEADPVLVAEGAVVTGIDAELDPGATISGHVTAAATGAGLEGIPVCAIDASTDVLAVCNGTYEGGEYELPFLPAGQYKVVFSIDFNEWFETEGFESDAFPTQFWNNQTSLAAANVISLSTGQSVDGIDARLGSPTQLTIPPVMPASATTPPPAAAPRSTAKPRRKHCRKGFKRKKVKGRYRCVRRKKHRHQHPRALAGAGELPLPGAAPSDGVASRPLFRVVR